MALVVTPGASNADAFVTVAACQTYATAKGLTFTGETADLESAIRRATTHLSTAFSWKGARTNGRSQALAWPRTDVEDAEGETVPDDEIPVEVEQACCELAVLELETPGVLSPAVDMTARIKSERVDAIATEYETAPRNAQAARPVVLLVRELVSGLLTQTGSPLVGRSVRA